jgi:hypothetical protein
MPRFQYVALDTRGQESTGSVEANSARRDIFQPAFMKKEKRRPRVTAK